MKICLAGEGWGCHAAYESLKDTFDKIYVNTSDIDLIKKIRRNDFLVNEIFFQNYDYIICAGFKPIITKKDLLKSNIINVHYSLLPKYRGMHSTVWAILNGEEKVGLSIHLVNEFIDDGDIIAQHEITYDGQTSTDIILECNRFVEGNLGRIVSSFISGNIIAKPQDKKKATWCCKRNTDDCFIDFDKTIDYLKRFFKALSKPYPIPRIKIKNEVYQIEAFDFQARNYLMDNGRVVNVDDEGAWIKVNDGFLIVKEISDINGMRISVKNLFNNGMRLR